MARSVPSGTPERPTGYLPLHRRGRLMLGSLLSAAALPVIAFALYASGYRTVASPGPLTVRHSVVESRCEECHRPAVPHTVMNLRCERCHDPRATGRLGDSAHARWVPASQPRVGARPALSCAHCHTDHAGRAASPRVVDTRECSACHGFSGVARHPEFAAAAGRQAIRGLKFSHALHVGETQRVLGRGCEACHRLTPDLSTFEPVSFDRHCATCHLTKGVLPAMTDPLPAAAVSISEGGPGQALTVRRPRPDRLVISGMRHRDPWIVSTLDRLNRGLAPSDDIALRDRLAARLAALERVRREGTLSARSPDALERLLTDLRAAPSTVADVAIAPTSVERTESRGRLERQATLELERRRQGGAAPISLAATLADDRALESAIVSTRRELADVDRRVTTAPVSPAERAVRTRAIQALLVPCLTCHELKDETRIAPVVQGPQFTMARFTHAPHVVQVACDTCHRTASASALAADLLTPGIQTCRTCHGGKAEAPVACTACHRYHPSPDAGLDGSAFR